MPKLTVEIAVPNGYKKRTVTLPLTVGEKCWVCDDTMTKTQQFKAKAFGPYTIAALHIELAGKGGRMLAYIMEGDDPAVTVELTASVFATKAEAQAEADNRNQPEDPANEGETTDE